MTGPAASEGRPIGLPWDVSDSLTKAMRRVADAQAAYSRALILDMGEPAESDREQELQAAQRAWHGLLDQLGAAPAERSS